MNTDGTINCTLSWVSGDLGSRKGSIMEDVGDAIIEDRPWRMDGFTRRTWWRRAVWGRRHEHTYVRTRAYGIFSLMMNSEVREKEYVAEDEVEKVSKVAFLLCFNSVSLGCLSQLIYNDLLDTINYSALKQKLILLLIIQIKLMDEYLEMARQAVKKKNPLSVVTTYHWKSGLSQHCATK